MGAPSQLQLAAANLHNLEYTKFMRAPWPLTRKLGHLRLVRGRWQSRARSHKLGSRPLRPKSDSNCAAMRYDAMGH
jgi:hypothetical protein